MALTAQQIAALANQAAEQKNMNETKEGGDFKPLPAGKCMLRFAGYIEFGEQKSVFKGVEKFQNKAMLEFQVFGKNYPPNEKGEPPRITMTVTNSQNEKSGIVKAFKSMNYNGDLLHIAQALGNAYIAELVHNDNGKDGAEKKIYVNIKDSQFSAPRVENPVDGTITEINVPPVHGDLRLFLWDLPNIEGWNALFIEGQSDKGKSKNWIQDKILSAKNYPGSPVEAMIAEVALNNGGSVPAQQVAQPAPASEAAQPASQASAEEAVDPLADLAI